MTKWSDDSHTSLQSNMKAEADGEMGREGLIADTEVQSLCVCVCVFNGNNPSSAEDHYMP